jgi:beta-lactamase class A
MTEIVKNCVKAFNINGLVLGSLFLAAVGFFVFHTITHAELLGRPKPGEECSPIFEAALQNPKVRVSYVYIDLVKGTRCELRADESVASASLYKLLLMIELHNRVELGHNSFMDEIVVMPWHGEFTPEEDRYPVPTIVTLGEAIRSSVSWSSNPEAEALHEYLGIESVNQTARNLGLEGTVAGPRYFQTTARDQALIFDKIYKSELISSNASSSMLQLLLTQRIEDYMRMGLPPEVEVAHKTGLILEYANDAGVVYGERGPFILVILTRREDNSWSSFPMAQEVMTDLARAAYSMHGR